MNTTTSSPGANPYAGEPEFPATARNWQGFEQHIQWPAKKKLLARVESVFLLKTGRATYAVAYGLQVKDALTNEQAASEFGQCIMHQAQCNGLLD